MLPTTTLGALGALGAFLIAPTTGLLSPASAASGERVAVRAGTIHLVEDGVVLTDGGTILIEGGKIAAIGSDVTLPPGTRVVDYGPDAVIVPGLVAVDSNYGVSRPGPRTAEPDLRAVDGFDPYTTYYSALLGGVTTAYLPPAEGRLIAGQGAVVKLAGEASNGRVLSASASVHGSIGGDARNTPSFWEPPVPATVDVGLGVAQAQLPRTVMGAIVALEELLALSRGEGGEDEYGPYAGPVLADLIERGVPWRMGANTEPEIRALLEFFGKHELPLVIDGGQGAADLATEIAAAGVPVVVVSPILANRSPRDHGKDEDAAWPRFDVAARLAAAGVEIAISTPMDARPFDLRFAASMASQGGLPAETALSAITLTPARILGVADRVGSLAVGKDADLMVLNDAPFAPGANVVATWVDGDVTFKGDENEAVVLAVNELHVGNGEIIAPAEVLMRDGRIVEVGRRVGRPRGATVIRGEVAIPGMIDAMGHLGLEGSKKVPAPRFELARLVEPGDHADKRVAQAGVTTVALAPRGAGAKGAPVMAYKPAGEQFDHQVVDDPAALRFTWTDKNRTESGRRVRDLLQKAVDYDQKWKKYEQEMAAWTPPAAKPAKGDDDEEEKDDEDAEKGGKKDDDKKKSKKKKKKKKKDEPAKPITGAWVAHVTLPPYESSRMRLYVLDEDSEIRGSLRCEALTDGLIDIEGSRDDRDVELTGHGSRGAVKITAEIVDGDEDEEEPNKLKGTVELAGNSVEFEAEQTSKEYVVAKRAERRREPQPGKVKGAPKKPSHDPDLEPLRRALHGEVAILVTVDREDEILACVDAFEQVKLKPILIGAEDAWKVAEQIADRVAGVLLSNEVVRRDARKGIELRNRYAELAGAGVRVAFHSEAEEGAAELPLVARYAVANGMSAEGALRALTSDAAEMLAIDDRVGRLERGLDADVLLLDGDPFDPSTRVLRVWVNGREVR